MSVLALLSVAGLYQEPAVQTTSFTSDLIGIAITHPTTWKVAQNKDDVWFTIPLATGGVAAVHLVPAKFQADIEIWQKSQEAMARQMEMELLRQWTEEIMGVPLLLTRVRSAPGKLAAALKAVPALPSDQPLITTVGLVYSATNRKMLFRVTAAETSFDEADKVWKQTLETLRTTSGQLFTSESPDRRPETIPGPGETPARPPSFTTVGGTPTRPITTPTVRAPKAVEAFAGEKKLAVYVPEGWASVKGEDGKYSLRHDAAGIVLSLIGYEVLSADPPGRTLIKMSAESLAAFDKVEARYDRAPGKNKAGNSVSTIWRFGQGKAGPMHSFEAVAGSGDYYIIVSLRKEGKVTPEQRKLIDDLLDQISVEPGV